MSEPLREIVIVGVGGNCIDILDIVEEINRVGENPIYRVIGFLDDDNDKIGYAYRGIKVLDELRGAGSLPDVSFVFGIGSPGNFARREEIFNKMGVGPERFESLVHPSTSISKYTSLGRGIVVFPNVTIGSGTEIGDYVIILPNSVISHDTKVGVFTCIAGGTCVSGGVTVGQSCYLGTNCCIKGNVTIGDYCMIGMGSSVLKDIPAGQVYAGNPARHIKTTRELIK